MASSLWRDERQARVTARKDSCGLVTGKSRCRRRYF
jgi:hypothetical protein